MRFSHRQLSSVCYSPQKHVVLSMSGYIGKVLEVMHTVLAS